MSDLDSQSKYQRASEDPFEGKFQTVALAHPMAVKCLVVIRLHAQGGLNLGGLGAMQRSMSALQLQQNQQQQQLLMQLAMNPQALAQVCLPQLDSGEVTPSADAGLPWGVQVPLLLRLSACCSCPPCEWAACPPTRTPTPTCPGASPIAAMTTWREAASAAGQQTQQWRLSVAHSRIASSPSTRPKF